MSWYWTLLLHFMSMYNSICACLCRNTFSNTKKRLKNYLLRGVVTHFAYIASKEVGEHGSKNVCYLPVFDLEHKTLWQLMWHTFVKPDVFNDDAIKASMSSFLFIKVEYCVMICRNKSGERMMIINAVHDTSETSDVSSLQQCFVYANYKSTDSGKFKDVSSEMKEVLQSCKVSNNAIPTYVFLLLLKHLYDRSDVGNVMSSEIHLMESDTLNEHIYKGEKLLVL